MELTSDRYAQWIKPRWDKYLEEVYAPPQEPVEVVEQPKYVLWVQGGRALYDGEMMGLAELDFVDGTHYDGENSYVYRIGGNFQIQVNTPTEAKLIVERITGCLALGLAELGDDGEYWEWYDEAGLAVDEVEEVNA